MFALLQRSFEKNNKIYYLSIQNNRFQLAALKMLMNIENLVICVQIDGKLLHKVQKVT